MLQEIELSMKRNGMDEDFSKLILEVGKLSQRASLKKLPRVQRLQSLKQILLCLLLMPKLDH